MAIKARNVAADGKKVMTINEFKRWLMRFDSDGDHRISRGELAGAVRAAGWRFARWKGKKGVVSADLNGDGFVDEDEFKNLAGFAAKYFRIKVLNL